MENDGMKTLYAVANGIPRPCPSPLVTGEGIYPQPTEDQQREAGYRYERFLTPRPEDGEWMEAWEVDEFAEIVSQVWIPAPPTPYEISKIQLREALKSEGLGEAFRGFLTAQEELGEYWADATTLASDDPRFLYAMDAFCSVFSVTDEVKERILKAGRKQ
jgi:hypothetical protein